MSNNLETIVEYQENIENILRRPEIIKFLEENRIRQNNERLNRERNKDSTEESNYEKFTKYFCFFLLIIIFALDIYQIILSSNRISNAHWNSDNNYLNSIIITYLFLSCSAIIPKLFNICFHFLYPIIGIFSLSVSCFIFYLIPSILGLKWLNVYQGDDDNLYSDVKRSLIIVWFNFVTFFYFIIVSIINYHFFSD
jgi:hypothetical protein